MKRPDFMRRPDFRRASLFISAAGSNKGRNVVLVARAARGASGRVPKKEAPAMWDRGLPVCRGSD